MQHDYPSWLPTLFIFPLVAFILYRRVGRIFGRQKIDPKRMILRITLLVAVAVVMVALIPTSAGFAAAATGLVIGLALAFYGLRHTTYEATPEGNFYTPNKWIGLLVTALLLGRIVGRMISVYETAAAWDPSSPYGATLQRSPLTSGIFVLMATYYVAYYIGLIKRGREIRLNAVPPEALP